MFDIYLLSQIPFTQLLTSVRHDVILMPMKDSRIAVRLLPEQRQQIEKAIRKGQFKTLSDCVRIAIEKLLEVNV